MPSNDRVCENNARQATTYYRESFATHCGDTSGFKVAKDLTASNYDSEESE
jgi:hypothetical protein